MISRSICVYPVIVLICILSFPFAVFAQELKPVYDGRLSPKPGLVTENLKSLISEKLQPSARAYLKMEEEEPDCMPGSEAEALDIANGSFTAPNLDQKALLYRFCATGPSKAMNGIAVIENDRVISHLVFEGGMDVAIGALPDINGNGRSEILIASGGTHMGETWRSISIIELSDTIVLTKFGQMKAYEDNCGGAIKKGKGRAEAFRLMAKKDGTFYRQAFIGKDGCLETGKWVKSGDLKQYSPENDETSYDFVK